MTFASSSPVRFSSIRVSAKTLLAWGVSYANRSPRFKRLALRVLSRMPALAVRLRQMYLGSQPAANWSEGTTLAGERITAHGVGCPSIGQAQQLMLDGINARQRSPLEAHFHTYVGRE